MSSRAINYQYVFTLPRDEGNDKKRPPQSQFTLQQYGSGDVSLRSTGSQKVHAQNTCTGLDGLRTRGVLCDVKLKVDGREICAHRNVLAVHSDYFQAMFTTGLEESHQDCIHMQGLSYEGLRACVDYIYTGSIQVHKDYLQDVVVAADLLQMKDLKEGSAHVLMTYLDSSNSIGFWLFSTQFSCYELQSMSMHYIKKRFCSIIHREEFLSLPPEKVCELLALEDLDLGSRGEDVVVAAVIKWLEQEPEREEHALRLLEKIHMKNISEECRERLHTSEVVRCHIPELTAEMSKSATESVAGRSHRKQIYVAGGFLQSRTGPVCPKVKTAEVYTPWEDSWRQTWLLPVQACALYAFPLLGRLLCIVSEAGEDGNPAGVQLLEFDIIQERWEPITEGVSKYALDHLHQTLRCGGSLLYCDWNSRLYTCTPSSFGYLTSQERDIQIDFPDKHMLSSIPNPVADTLRVDNALVSHRGTVFSLGGTIQYSKTQVTGTADVYRFHEDTNCWEQKASMAEPRSQLAAVALGDHLYAVGGFSQIRLQTVERFSLVTEQWETLAPMNKHRSHATAVTLGNHLYIMGGKSYADNYQCGGARKVLRSSERYDVTQPGRGWTYVEDMDTARCLFAAATF